jgi:hypothetical protein
MHILSPIINLLPCRRNQKNRKKLAQTPASGVLKHAVRNWPKSRLSFYLVVCIFWIATAYQPEKMQFRDLHELTDAHSFHAPMCMFIIILQNLVQSCSREGRGIGENMCYGSQRAKACVD